MDNINQPLPMNGDNGGIRVEGTTRRPYKEL